jgi:hypothetical protein
MPVTVTVTEIRAWLAANQPDTLSRLAASPRADDALVEAQRRVAVWLAFAELAQAHPDFFLVLPNEDARYRRLADWGELETEAMTEVCRNWRLWACHAPLDSPTHRRVAALVEDEDPALAAALTSSPPGRAILDRMVAMVQSTATEITAVAADPAPDSSMVTRWRERLADEPVETAAIRWVVASTDWMAELEELASGEDPEAELARMEAALASARAARLI